MDSQALALLVIGILGTGLGAAAKALFERGALKAKANSDDATATSTVIAAARELVDPLRKELAEERRSHASEIAEERANAAALHAELQACRKEAQGLRREIQAAWTENHKLRRRVIELEAQR